MKNSSALASPDVPSGGSGYRLSKTTVLTAAHVVADARAVQVVFNPDLPDEWSSPATVEALESAGDDGFSATRRSARFGRAPVGARGRRP
jgi:hypothetical protein